MKKINIALVLLSVLFAAPSFAATVEEMHRTDKLMTEADTVTGAVTLLTKLKGLFGCEDQLKNLCMTSGGVVRGSEGNIINSAVGNATSAAFVLPTGNKSITARITGAGAVAQQIDIYGGTSNGMVVATSTKLCTITLSGTSGAAGTADMCPPFVAPALFYVAVTSGSSGTPTTILTASY